MISEWVLYASLAGIFSNAFSYFSRLFLKDEGDSTAWAWFFETGRLVLFLIVLFFNFYLQPSLKVWVLLILIGLTEFVSVYLHMKMHAYSELSISSILSRSRMVWIPVIAFLLFGEVLNTAQYLGILVLFIGLSLAISPKKWFVDRGAVYANIAAVIIALNVVLIKETAPFASAPVLMIAASFPSVFLFPLLMKNPLKRLPAFSKDKFGLKAFSVFIQFLSAYFLVLALQKGEVSIVNSIYQGMMVFAVLAGIIFLKERTNIIKKILGSIVALLGVLLLK